MKKIILAKCILLSLMMTGCAEMNSQFDCPMKPGVSCKSLDEVNHDIDKHENNTMSLSKVNNSSSGESDHSFRTEDATQRVWIAPFEDTNGNYHEASNVMIVTDHSHWKNNTFNVTNNGERSQ